jgi:hypothetical protein
LVYSRSTAGAFMGDYVEVAAGCSKRLSSKAAVSEDRRRTLWGTLKI